MYILLPKSTPQVMPPKPEAQLFLIDKKSNFVFSVRPVTASLYTGGVGAFCYAVFGWLEYPEIKTFHVIDYILTGWLLNCLAIALLPALAWRSVKYTFFGLCSGLIFYFLTRWGFEGLDGEPTVGFVRVSFALIEMGVLVAIYLSICLHSSKIIIKCCIAGVLSGLIAIIAHLPYLYISNTTDTIDITIWQRLLFVWGVLLFIVMPAISFFPSWVIDCSMACGLKTRIPQVAHPAKTGEGSDPPNAA